jgi:hypothetical protein
MSKFKISICEVSLLLLSKNYEVGTNFTFFYEAEMLKLGVFCKPFIKLS